jgi:hypothetical protein
LAYLQGFEELVVIKICNMDLLNGIANTILNAHSTIHFVYGFDLLCQTLNHGMTSSIFHFNVLGSSTWAYVMVYHLYDPSCIDIMVDGVSTHSLL